MAKAKSYKAFFGRIERFLKPYSGPELAIAGVGLLAVIGIIFSLFLAPERLTEEITSKDVAAANSPEFLDGVSHITGSRIHTGGEAQILKNGDGFLNAILADIATAKETITFTNYIWAGGEFSDKLTAALVDRARAGVRVLILLDDVGSTMPKKQKQELEHAGAEIVLFRVPQLAQFTTTHKRTHRRAMVIDGKIGYEGGVAIADSWLGDASQPDHWRDTMVRVIGPLVPQIQESFAELWAAATGEILESKFYPSTPEEADGLKTISINSAPAPSVQKLPLLFWYSFRGARKSIYLTNPYFLPEPAVLKALTDAAKRGVDVRLLLPSHHTDSRSVRLASQNNYAALLEAGVKIYEYQRAQLHAKTFVVDGGWSVIGSANMDSRSMFLNEEDDIGIQNDDFGQEMQAMFMDDLRDAKEITKDEWQRRDWFLKVFQWAASVFHKQL